MISKQDDLVKIRLFKENRRVIPKNFQTYEFVKWIIKSVFLSVPGFKPPNDSEYTL